MQVARIRRRLQRSEGFTLIELMVVIAIIGVLTALIIPRVLAAQNQAKINDTVNQVRVIEAALEQSYSASAALPADQTTWSAFDAEISQYGSLPSDVQDDTGSAITGATQDYNFAGWASTGGIGTLLLTINDTHGTTDAVELVTNDPASAPKSPVTASTWQIYTGTVTWSGSTPTFTSTSQVASGAW